MIQNLFTVQFIFYANYNKIVHYALMLKIFCKKLL